MPIIPRYEVRDTPIQTPRVPVAPADDSTAALFKGLHEVGQTALRGLSDYTDRARRLEDATELAKRRMRAELDIDTLIDGFRTDRASQPEAPERFERAVADLRTQWRDGLRPEVQAKLDEYLIPRLIQGMKSARDIRHKYLIDDAHASRIESRKALVDKAARLDLTDAQAFQDVYLDLATEDGGRKRRPGAYIDLLEAQFAAGLLDRDGATREEQETLAAMASARLTRLMISDNPELVRRGLAVLEEEEGRRGSTYASHLTAEQRNSLLKAGQGQLESLRQRAISDEDRSIRLSRERQKDIDEQQKRVDLGEISDLTLGILRGEKGHADLSRQAIYNPTLKQDPTRMEHLYRLIEERRKGGGTTNWTLYVDLWRQIRGARGAVDASALVLPYAGRPNGLSIDDAEKLIAYGKSAAEDTVFKDDFYQAGQRDLDRALAPPVGVIDEGKAQRYAEASREFYDRAAPLIRSGKRDQVPQLSREIADRYVKQAPSATAVPPRYTPRFPSREETVKGFTSQYGPPETWPQSVRREFDRQILIHDELNPPAPFSASDEVRQRQSAPKSGDNTKPSSKSKSKLPNPIPSD